MSTLKNNKSRKKSYNLESINNDSASVDIITVLNHSNKIEMNETYSVVWSLPLICILFHSNPVHCL